MSACTAYTLEKLMAMHPLLRHMGQGQPLCWANPQRRPLDQALSQIPFAPAEVDEAAARLQRFAPYMAQTFPETAEAGGIIESPLRAIPAMQQRLSALWGRPVPGRVLLKMDSHLPVSGSIKARGGFYEVLVLAERLALQQGLLRLEDDYACLASDKARAFFGEYSLAVGSTGNLGLSVGLMGAALGFRTTVHMSADARQWKKDLLRSRGVRVVEYPEDYSQAVAAGREAAARDSHCHFVDDESSRDLFLGYAVAGRRVAAQLRAADVVVDREHPLYVYLPCGVGGGPGGVALGLKLLFGDAVSCFFAEPTHAPSVLLGLLTGLGQQVSVKDLGLDGRTAADGLAVARPSGLVCQTMRPLLDGAFTVRDETLYQLLYHLERSEGICLEPSAVAGFPGIFHAVAGRMGDLAHPEKATHMVWATGGSLVPPEEQAAYLHTGERHAAAPLEV